MRVVRVRCKLDIADYAAGKNETLRERIIVLADLQRDPIDMTPGDAVWTGPPPNKCVAKACGSECSVTRLSMPAA